MYFTSYKLNYPQKYFFLVFLCFTTLNKTLQLVNILLRINSKVQIVTLKVLKIKYFLGRSNIWLTFGKCVTKTTFIFKGNRKKVNRDKEIRELQNKAESFENAMQGFFCQESKLLPKYKEYLLLIKSFNTRSLYCKYVE